MGKKVGQPLTARQVAGLDIAGMYCDGDGLYLKIGKTSGKSWILRTVVYGQRRDFGLGSAKLVTLAEARMAAYEMRKVARSGGNPDNSRSQETLTFEEAAKRTHKAQLPKWSSDRHGENWWNSIDKYVLPSLGSMPLEKIGIRDIHQILEPIWSTKYDTAKKLRQRIALIFDWAKGSGHFKQENPVNGLKQALPTPKRAVRHHPALKWKLLPDFMAKLSRRKETSARLMEFAILTCVRSNEARGACWDEIEGGTWRVPASRMKSRLEHRVPLPKQCISLLDRVARMDDKLIFPSSFAGWKHSDRKMSDQVFAALMKRMDVQGITMHGFRSTFKDWCSEYAKADWELSEMALAHTVGNAVERAYARSDLFDRRKELMQDWANFALGETSLGATKKRIKSRPTSLIAKQKLRDRGE